jgi:ferredoxin
VRVRVDPDLCASTGYCAEVAPSVFKLPETGPVEVIAVSPEPVVWDLVREAVDLCPTDAIASESDDE